MGLVVADTPGAIPGCGDTRKKGKGAYGDWYCTAHVTVEGRVVHVADNATRVCAMWSVEDGDPEGHLDWTSPSMDDAPKSWEEALGLWLEAYPTVEVSEESLEEAASSLIKMLQSLEGT